MKMNTAYIVIICSLFAEGIALSCYQCTSSKHNPNPGCIGRVLDPKFLTQCSQGEDFCTIEMKNTTDGDFSVSRRCCTEPRPYHCTSNYEAKSCVGTCDEDECNTGDVATLKTELHECYQCTSRDKRNGRCETETLDPSYRQTCPKGYNYCRVTKLESAGFFFGRDPTTTLLRECTKYSFSGCFGNLLFNYYCFQACKGKRGGLRCFQQRGILETNVIRRSDMHIGAGGDGGEISLATEVSPSRLKL